MLAGTFRPDRDHGAAEPLRAIPDPPAALSAVARREWDRNAPLLHAQGLMAEDYRDALAFYCSTFSRWELLEAALVETPLDDKLHASLNKVLELMRKFLAEFGLTPASRQRVTPVIEQRKNPGNRFAGIG